MNFIRCSYCSTRFYSGNDIVCSVSSLMWGGCMSNMIRRGLKDFSLSPILSSNVEVGKKEY